MRQKNPFSQRTWLWLAFLIIILTLASPLLLAEAPLQQFNLTIIHSNDFHDFEPYALARRYTLIKQIRAEVKNSLLLDAGDLYNRGKYHTVFYGEMEMAAMNAMGYDAWEIGNNEFKGHADQATNDQKLLNLINQAKFPTLCANIKINGQGDYIPSVKPYIVKTVGGIKIGIIGVCADRVKEYPQSSNKTVADAFDTTSKLMPKVASESDIQIVLSHAGLPVDIKIADKLRDSGISAIISADDHIMTPQPITNPKGFPITQAGGEERMFLGRLDLTYEFKNNKWVLASFKGVLFPINDQVPLNPEIKAIIDNYMAKVLKPAV